MDYLINFMTGKNGAYDGITNFQTIMKSQQPDYDLKTPVTFHSASAVRIPHSIHDIRNLIPSV